MGVSAPVSDPFEALADPQTLADPYPVYRAIRETGPVLRSATGQWVVSSYDGVDAVLNDTRFSSDPRHITAMPAPPDDDLTRYAFEMLIFKDPPDHERLRSLVNKAFSPHAVKHMRDTIGAATDELLEPLLRQGRMDIVTDLAFPLPVKVICAMLGVPREDTPKLRELSDRLSKMLDPTKVDIPEVRAAALDATGGFLEYFGALTERRRADPQDDLVSALVHAEDEGGGKLSHAELMGNLMLLMVAGHETTANLIGNSMRAFLMHPDEWRRLVADPELVGGAVEECLRFDGPLQIRTRVATEDIELLGETIGKGEMLILLLGSANHDPAHFPEPERFDITREIDRAFAHGDGIHYCLGSALSREEARTALGRLARETSDIAVDGDLAALPRHDSLAVRGITSLPVTFTPRAG